MLPRDWQLIDGWDLQVFLGPLEQFIIMITDTQTLRVISKSLSVSKSNIFRKELSKTTRKLKSDVIFISSSFESKSVQPLLSLSESTIDLLSFTSHFILNSIHLSIFLDITLNRFFLINYMSVFVSIFLVSGLWRRLDFFAINFVFKFLKLIIEFKCFLTVLLFLCNFITQQCTSSFDRLLIFIMIE